ncbi:hypothetical protein QJS10_CPB15g01628 [Acorus calamus]|uniref:PORR domain-containing protein n=1 Tax=Acorus calamus TaxID=4465 RepID=A0AAV9D457_ACOCL|nr:hypothetical protein QJS10_CPB15g01628 [Acorus calamus]
MSRHQIFTSKTLSKTLKNPNLRNLWTSPLSPKSFKNRKKPQTPRESPIQPEPIRRTPHFESILRRDSLLRFITRTKAYLSLQPEHVLLLDEAGKLHRELGFPRGRKVIRSVHRHPSLLQTYRHGDGKVWIGFTDLMEDLLREEASIMDSMETQRMIAVRKLLMMSAEKRMPLSKIHHCRHVFGIPDDFRDRVLKYPEHFRVSVDEDGRPVLELVEWDPSLAVSALERDFVTDEDGVKRAFRFPFEGAKSLGLDVDNERKLNLLNTLPLVSPYSEGSGLKPWSLEAEKYRVGVVHEFLSLTLEKRALIHHIMEFKEELSLTKHLYWDLVKQARTFYLAGTEMNWAVFLKSAYDDGGELIDEDPQVLFNQKLWRYALEDDPLSAIQRIQV